KLGVIEYFKDRAATFLMGGAAANTFLKIKGADIGKSLIDDVADDYAALTQAVKYPNLILPIDWREEKNAILDIGPKSEKLFAGRISKAKTIIWSGPMGNAERKKFASGNNTVARAIASNKGAVKIAGGGETVMFLRDKGLDKKFTFISTGGSAMLDYLAGEKLPGILALDH
ncbi:MAG: phosphoglycerate kinase, partial [Candidatus Liptonbacteria bacterium]